MATATRKLDTYRSMRRFGKTPEPAGGAAPRPGAPLSFVVQKHAASHLHYDFRLELDGVLLSWAVPKGPTLDPATKRLAMQTEDHPIEYADFEGIIPEGEYGGGTVIVWDRGAWAPEGDPRDGMRRGRLTFTLAGEKLRGRFHLVKKGGDHKGNAWLLFKGKDDEARTGVELPEASVLSGRTLDDVRAKPDRVWHSNKKSREGAKSAKKNPRSRPSHLRGSSDLSGLIAALPASLPRSLSLTNLDKVLYPEQGLTKGALIAYHAIVAPWMLPHIADRPLTLMRCPNGPGAHCFYQKHAKDGTPAAIHRVPIDGEQYMAVSDLEGLLSLANLGALEISTWGCRRDRVDRPDLLVFDLDPDEALPWDAVVEAALELRAHLTDLELVSFVKTTGGKGLHLAVPIARRVDWDTAKDFTRDVAIAMTRARPDRYVAEMGKAKRRGKIFIDYLRNGLQASAIAPYSMRARAGAPVAAPLSWEELERGVSPADFTVTTMPARVQALRRDPWVDLPDVSQSIKPRASRRRAASGSRR
ncbi:MAG TPA: non-homologous end-joining DNA ligase [Kofleriaceae bacterium]|nr:non-homologous end-joining DNA ligase [Kofleriaceae bacterium]